MENEDNAIHGWGRDAARRAEGKANRKPEENHPCISAKGLAAVKRREEREEVGKNGGRLRECTFWGEKKASVWSLEKNQSIIRGDHRRSMDGEKRCLE